MPVERNEGEEEVGDDDQRRQDHPTLRAAPAVGQEQCQGDERERLVEEQPGMAADEEIAGVLDQLARRGVGDLEDPPPAGGLPAQLLRFRVVRQRLGLHRQPVRRVDVVALAIDAEVGGRVAGEGHRQPGEDGERQRAQPPASRRAPSTSVAQQAKAHRQPERQHHRLVVDPEAEGAG